MSLVIDLLEIFFLTSVLVMVGLVKAHLGFDVPFWSRTSTSQLWWLLAVLFWLPIIERVARSLLNWYFNALCFIAIICCLLVSMYPTPPWFGVVAIGVLLLVYAILLFTKFAPTTLVGKWSKRLQLSLAVGLVLLLILRLPDALPSPESHEDFKALTDRLSRFLQTTVAADQEQLWLLRNNMRDSDRDLWEFDFQNAETGDIAILHVGPETRDIIHIRLLGGVSTSPEATPDTPPDTPPAIPADVEELANKVQKAFFYFGNRNTDTPIPAPPDRRGSRSDRISRMKGRRS